MEFNIQFFLVALLPALSTGVLLASGIIFLYLSVLTSSRLHLSMLFLTAVALVLTSSQLFAILFGHVDGWFDVSAQFYRLEQLMGAFFIVAIPVLMYGLSHPSADWIRTHSTISVVAMGIVAVFTVAAFAVPDLFVSISEDVEQVQNAALDTRRTEHGPLKTVRDLLLAVTVIYMLVSLSTSMRAGKRRILVPLFVSLSAAALFGFDDIWHAHTGSSFLTGTVPTAQRFPVGVTLFTLTATGTVLFAYVRDAERMGQMRDRLAYLVYYDQLTGLRNRKSFYERLHNYCRRASTRDKEQLAVLLIDLDRFKDVNDTLGPEIGDQVLIEVRDRLSAQAQSSDTVFRIGGDEFSVLLPGILDIAEAEQTASRIIAAMRSPFSIHDRIIYIGCTIGISIYPEDGRTEALIRHADAALFEAKKDRNTYRLFTDEMQRNTSHTMKLINELRHALASNELYLRYQPQVTPDGRVSGMEVLARWHNNVLGHVSPVSFIPAAEETGLIIPIGYWVLEQACFQLKRWINMGLTPVPVAVNVSSKQLNDPEFSSKVFDILNRYDLPAELLHIEITESVLLDPSDTISETITQLVDAGLHLVIDDFGVGYSSLAYIRRLPISVVKLDRSFLLNVPGDERDCELVRGIQGLVRGLGLTMIAEGVENDEQAAFVRRIGSNMQGFQIERPLEPSEIIGVLSDKVIYAEI